MSSSVPSSADFFSAVTATMGEGLYATDAQNRITFMNAAVEAMLGWTFEELRGRRMHDVAHHHHPDGRPFPIEDCAVVRVLRDGHTLRDHDDFRSDVRRAARPTHARRGAPPPPRRPTLPHRGLRRRSRAPRRTYAARPRRLLHS